MSGWATVGTAAPDFRAPSSHGQTLDRDSFIGKVAVVLVLLPDRSDATDRLLDELDAHLVDFGRARVQLLAVLPASPRDVRTLVEERGLNLTVLADEAALADGTASITESYVGGLEHGQAGVVFVHCSGELADRWLLPIEPGMGARVLERAETLETRG